MDKILLTVNNTTFSASLLDNALADKFMEQLPLTMDMSELNASEKFYSFSESFPVQGERVGKIEKGDLMFLVLILSFYSIKVFPLPIRILV